MAKNNNYSDKITTALAGVLPPHVNLVLLRVTGTDAVFKLAGRTIRARWIASGWPAQILAAIADKTNLPDIVVAPQISPGAKEILAAKSIGWLDENGAAEFLVGNVIVSRSDIKKKQTQLPRSKKWSPSMLAVAEALLCKNEATVEAIVTATGLSTGACTKALRRLTDINLLVADVARGPLSARRITEKRQLLEAYVGAVTEAEKRVSVSLEVGGTWQDLLKGITESGLRWDELGVLWAATGAAAAEVMAPSMTTLGSAVVYLDATSILELATLARRVGLTPIDGGRVTLKPFPTRSTLRLVNVIDHVRVAPWPRVYADLVKVGVRGEDAGEHLWEVIHGR